MPSVPSQKKQSLDIFHVQQIFSQYYRPDDSTIFQLVDLCKCGSIGFGMLYFWKQRRLINLPSLSC